MRGKALGRWEWGSHLTNLEPPTNMDKIVLLGKICMCVCVQDWERWKAEKIKAEILFKL